MRPLPVIVGAALLILLGFVGGFFLSSAGTVEVPVAPAVGGSAVQPEAADKAAPRVVVADDAAALRARVRELEDELEAKDAGGEAELLTVGEDGQPMPHRMDGGFEFTGEPGGELPPEIAERIAQAVEGALGEGQLDCEDGDCVLIGPDGQPMEGVQVQTMGDFDPNEIGALLEEALGEGAVVGEPSVGVMILDAQIEVPEDAPE